MPEQSRPQQPAPERVTEEDLFTPQAMVRLIVKGAERRFRTRGEVLENLNRCLDAFDAQLGKVPVDLRNQDAGARFVEKALAVLQGEIEAREPQMVLNQDARSGT